MKNILFLCLLVVFISCGQSDNTPAETTVSAGTDSPAPQPEEEKVFDYPVLYKNWKIGDHANTRMVLQMYKAWDNKAVNDMKALISDSMIMDLPNGVRRAGGKDQLVAGLLKSREAYASASNDILAAYPLVSLDNNHQWVNVLVYNKWTYKDKARDSMLYMDLWKINEGRISYLMSLEQTPSRMEVKRLEKLVATK